MAVTVKIFLEIDNQPEIRRISGEFSWTDLVCRLYKMWPKLFEENPNYDSDTP
eukprot:gene998-12226_t